MNYVSTCSFSFFISEFLSVLAFRQQHHQPGAFGRSDIFIVCSFFISEFLSVLAFRQQHHQPGAFGRSDIFIVCRLKPLNFDIDHCHNEISHCKWMSLEELYKNTADQQYFSYIVAVSFIGGGNRSTRRKPQTSS